MLGTSGKFPQPIASLDFFYLFLLKHVLNIEKQIFPSIVFQFTTWFACMTAWAPLPNNNLSRKDYKTFVVFPKHTISQILSFQTWKLLIRKFSKSGKTNSYVPSKIYLTQTVHWQCYFLLLLLLLLIDRPVVCLS